MKYFFLSIFKLYNLEKFKMKTRSQSSSEKKKIFSVEIDFDEASEAWKANKKSIGNGSYKYICQSKTNSGNQCKRESNAGSHYCKTHTKVFEKKEKKEKTTEKVHKLCSGCFPIFQPNQLAHIGLYGCLGHDE